MRVAVSKIRPSSNCFFKIVEIFRNKSTIMHHSDSLDPMKSSLFSSIRECESFVNKKIDLDAYSEVKEYRILMSYRFVVPSKDLKNSPSLFQTSHILLKTISSNAPKG